MILGYCRVSTTKSEQDTSVKAQRQQLQSAGCQRIVEERRSAFKDSRRPGWETCKELIRSGMVSKFVVVSLSRASRRQETGEMSLLCKDHGVEFEVLTGGPVDVTTPEGLLNVGIQDTVNRFDSLLKSVRVRQGTAARRKAGATAIGKCPFGYRYNGRQPEPDPSQWALAQRLWAELSAQEFRATKLLHEQPQWAEHFSNSGLIRWMRNPMLMGIPRYDSEPVEPLVSPGEWDRCQRLLETRSFHKPRGGKVIRLCSGLVVCSGCGRRMNYAWANNKPRIKCMYPPCGYYGRGLAESKIRAQLIAALRESVHRLAEVANQPKATRQKTYTAEELAQRKQLEQLLKLQAEGVEGLEKPISDLRLALKVRKTMTGGAPPWDVWKQLILAPGALEAATDQELRAIAFDLVEEVSYIGDPNMVRVTFRDSAEGNPQ